MLPEPSLVLSAPRAVGAELPWGVPPVPALAGESEPRVGSAGLGRLLLAGERMCWTKPLKLNSFISRVLIFVG